MNFLGIGTGELLLILLIVLLVMGPERLPQLIRQWAKIVKSLSQFTRTWQQFNAELNRQLKLEEMAGQPPRQPAKPAQAPPPAASEAAENSIAPPELAQLDAGDTPPEPAAAAPPPGESSGGAGQEVEGADANEVQHER